MRHRFHSLAPLAAGAIVPLEGDELHHAHVLRVREGEEAEVFDGRGHAFAATMETLTSVRIGEAISPRESRLPLELAMSVIQLEKFELVLQKTTELGITAITPLITDRMEVRPERFRGKTERWQKIIFEAVKQCGRAAIPMLNEPMKVDAALKREGLKIVYDADEPSTPQLPDNPATLFIGPEGGFSPRELAVAHKAGAYFATLGPRRLRAETAGIVAVALMLQGR